MLNLYNKLVKEEKKNYSVKMGKMEMRTLITFFLFFRNKSI
jgi:hypothetical protein